MAKHTQGPWKYGQAGQNHWVHGPGGEAVSYAGGQDGIFTITPGVPHQANARLIARAPDLLEDMQRIASFRRKDGAYDKHDMAGAVVIAETAIAKAEGKQVCMDTGHTDRMRGPMLDDPSRFIRRCPRCGGGVESGHSDMWDDETDEHLYWGTDTQCHGPAGRAYTESGDGCGWCLHWDSDMSDVDRVAALVRELNAACAHEYAAVDKVPDDDTEPL